MTIEIKDGNLSHCIMPEDRADFNETMNHIHYQLRNAKTFLVNNVIVETKNPVILKYPLLQDKTTYTKELYNEVQSEVEKEVRLFLKNENLSISDFYSDDKHLFKVYVH